MLCKGNNYLRIIKHNRKVIIYTKRSPSLDFSERGATL